MSNTNLNDLIIESQQDVYFTYEQYCNILKYLTDFQDKYYYCFKIDTIENEQVDSVVVLDLKTLNTATISFNEYLNIRDQLYLIPIKYYKNETAYINFRFLAGIEQACYTAVKTLETNRDVRAFTTQPYLSLICSIFI